MASITQILVKPLRRQSSGSLRARLRHLVVVEKLNNPLGFAALFIVSAMAAVAIVKGGMIAGILIILAMVALPAAYAIIAFPRFGIVIFLVIAYLIMWISRMGVHFPLGTLMDAMEGLFLLGLFIHQKRENNWAIFKGPISLMIWVWIGYNIVEVINPAAASRVAWIYTVRTAALVTIMYFIFLQIIRTKAFIKIILKIWLALALFGAAYAFKQQHFGFFAFETRYLNSDPMIHQLLFIGGVWRKFSIFTDPVSFSYNMVIGSLLCVGLLTGPVSKKQRIILYCSIAFMILNMLYSGTRGSYVLLPVAMLLFTVLKYSRRVMIILCICAAMGVTLIFIPTSNKTLYRFQTAFKPSNDASYNVRVINQKRIQPFILAHPMGGGLGSTGVWGKRFSPNSELAHFPPDSGYVRIAVEMGWVGLFLFCLLMFTILKTGINNYFTIKDPQLKSYCLAATLIVFALNVGNFPQDAIIQYPTNEYFFLVTALITATMRIDKDQQLQHAAG